MLQSSLGMLNVTVVLPPWDPIKMLIFKLIPRKYNAYLDLLILASSHPCKVNIELSQ